MIPAELREALGVEPGDAIVIALEGAELRLFTPSHATRRAQAVVRRYVPQGNSLAAELIADRRAEAARDAAS